MSGSLANAVPNSTAWELQTFFTRRLEKRQVVRQRRRRDGHRGHAVGDAVHGAKRGTVRRADPIELAREGLRAGRREGEQEPSLRPEALHERRGGDAGLLRDVTEREI